MALTVAALVAEGETVLRDAACIAESYPSFVQTMADLGAQIR